MFCKLSLIRQMLHDPFGIIYRTVLTVHYLSKDLSGESCSPVKLHITASLSEIHRCFFSKPFLWLQMHQTKSPHITSLKYNIKFLHTVIMKFKEKSTLFSDFCFLVLILYIHTLQSGDFTGNLFPASVLQPDRQRPVKSSPSADTAKLFSGFHFDAFNKILGLSLFFLKLCSRSRKPLDALSPFYCIDTKFLLSFQLCRQADFHLHPLTIYQIQILKALQSTDTLLCTDNYRKRLTIENGFRLIVFGPGSLKMVNRAVLQIKPVFLYFV